MPITSTKVEKRPCLDRSKSSDFLYDGLSNAQMYENFGWKSPSDNVGKEFYPLELDRWHFFNINTEDRYYVYRCE